MTRRQKRALVTGGSSGLGAAITRDLVRRGFEVLVLDVKQPEDADPAARLFDCDLASRQDLDEALPKLVDAGPYDLVVLNAGINATGRFEDIKAKRHTEVIRVNAEAPMVIAASLFEAKALSKGAAMGFVSSLSHFTGYPGAASYAASKDALAIFAKSMRKYAERKGMTITVAFPGPLRTAHAEKHAPAGAEAGRRMEPRLAARRIVDDTLAGRKTSIPGTGNRVFALAGRLFPKPATAIIRGLIYDRLKR